jgi:hypothetical protein
LPRPGRWMVPPFRRFRASSISPSFWPSSPSESQRMIGRTFRNGEGPPLVNTRLRLRATAEHRRHGACRRHQPQVRGRAKRAEFKSKRSGGPKVDDEL